MDERRYAAAQRRSAKRSRLDTWMVFNHHLAPAVVGQLMGAATEAQLDDALAFCHRLQHIVDQGVDVELRVVPPTPADE